MSKVELIPETAVEDVWFSLGAPTSVEESVPGSAEPSPYVAPSRRTGGAYRSWATDQILTIVFNTARKQNINWSNLARILDRFEHSGPGSFAELTRELKRNNILFATLGNLRLEPSRISPLSSSTSSSADDPTSSERQTDHSQVVDTADHVRIAEEVRELTGLPTSSLAASLGVRREQYQRWLRGWPISAARHGQLIYLHTIANDVARRLGNEAVQIWWRTPIIDDGRTPEQLLQERRTDLVYQLATKLPDSSPEHDGMLLGLRTRQLIDDDEDAPEGIEDEEDWSPYGSQGE